jgi:GH25 family lysozyme M1 (1,4-beta-N-acetylmuramidase)
MDSLLVDCYEGDGTKNWAALAAAGEPWIGARLKASEGTYYRPTWFVEQLMKLAAACPERNGVTWFFGGYHYLKFNEDARAQADVFMQQLETAVAGAGLRAVPAPPGLLAPMVDVERAGQAASSLTAARVEDTTEAFAERILEVCGARPTLYGGELLAALGITSHLGCDRLAIARYTPELPHAVVTRIGWDQPDEWQYCGDGTAFLAGYPNEAPGCGKVDISAVVSTSSQTGLERLREQLTQ